MINFLKTKHPRFLSWAINGYFISKRSIWAGSVDWKSKKEYKGYGDNCLGDAATAIFLRILFEKKYSTVIEIGAYGAQRISKIKEILPDTTCYALDIQEGYEDQKNQLGVVFGKFDNKFTCVPTQTGKTIVIARQTFATMSKVDVIDTINGVREREFDIAIYDYQPNFSFKDSIIRGGQKPLHTYFHQYNDILAHIIHDYRRI